MLLTCSITSEPIGAFPKTLLSSTANHTAKSISESRGRVSPCKSRWYWVKSSFFHIRGLPASILSRSARPQTGCCPARSGFIGISQPYFYLSFSQSLESVEVPARLHHFGSDSTNPMAPALDISSRHANDHH